MTPRQKIFVLEYVRTGNATQSAKTAGYSEKTARKIGSRLLTYVDVKEAVRTRRDEIVQQYRDRCDETVEKIRQCYNYDVSKLITADGVLITNPADIPDEIKPAIQSIKIIKKKRTGEYLSPDGSTTHTWNSECENIWDELYEIKFTDKLKALELMGRFQALFTDNVNLGGQENLGVIRMPNKSPEGAECPETEENKA